VRSKQMHFREDLSWNKLQVFYGPHSSGISSTCMDRRVHTPPVSVPMRLSCEGILQYAGATERLPTYSGIWGCFNFIRGTKIGFTNCKLTSSAKIVPAFRSNGRLLSRARPWPREHFYMQVGEMQIPYGSFSKGTINN
jgi:hypothetical protein